MEDIWEKSELTDEEKEDLIREKCEAEGGK